MRGTAFDLYSIFEIEESVSNGTAEIVYEKTDKSVYYIKQLADAITYSSMLENSNYNILTDKDDMVVTLADWRGIIHHVRKICDESNYPMVSYLTSDNKLWTFYTDTGLGYTNILNERISIIDSKIKDGSILEKGRAFDLPHIFMFDEQCKTGTAELKLELSSTIREELKEFATTVLFAKSIADKRGEFLDKAIVSYLTTQWEEKIRVFDKYDISSGDILVTYYDFDTERLWSYHVLTHKEYVSGLNDIIIQLQEKYTISQREG